MSSKRRGTILIVVMIAIAALAGMVLALGRTVRIEAMATANHVASARAAAAEHAAEEYVIWALCRDRSSVMTLDESYWSAVPVGNDAVFWIVRPDYNDTNMPRYGLVDEASKLNFGQATRDMLRAIPIMPDPLPDSIFDWKDADSTVEDDGAEDEYYLAQPQPYRAKNDAFDDAIRLKFEATHFAAARGEYDGWRATAEGTLALLILLDQFPRNLFRGSAHAFATDGLARHVAVRALDAGHDAAFEPALRAFFYLPFEHSEAPADQDRSVALFDALGDANYRDYAHAHRDVIARFGRFPHRNAALGRDTTPAEQAWLDAGGGW